MSDGPNCTHFLIAAQQGFTYTEAARCVSEGQNTDARDPSARRLQRQRLDAEALRKEATPFVNPRKVLFAFDDTTLDKPWAQMMELVTCHWNGKHRRVVQGIAFLMLLCIIRDLLIVASNGGKPKSHC